MNKKIFFVITILMILVVALAIVRLISGEDDWICSNGQWVKHGAPSAPAPTTGCGVIKNVDKPEEMTTVQIFWNNDIFDAETSCTSVFPVDRKVIKDENIMQSTLEELLKGPTDQEKQEHYFTSINSDVVLNSLIVDDGVVKADFNKRIEEGGGSCWVTSIRAEITQTLMQFLEVKEVIISVEGRVEDALQP